MQRERSGSHNATERNEMNREQYIEMAEKIGRLETLLKMGGSLPEGPSASGEKPKP